MQFADIAAPKGLKERLLDMCASKRVPHALLFAGGEEGPQLPLAIAFAQFLFCSNPSASDSCGICPSCLKISKLAHPDFHLVFPIALSKDARMSDAVVKEFRESFLSFPYMSLNDWFNHLDAENKQPVIGAEESNEIIRKLSFTSYEGGKKIMIVWMPEKMNGVAANKLLKILEEPPDDTFFFLVSSAVDQLLPTILSRVQLITVSEPSVQETAAVIARHFEMPAQQAGQVAALARGNARQGFLLADDNTPQNLYLELFQNFMRACLRFDAFKITAWIDEMVSLGREKQKQFFLYALQMTRNCLLEKHVPEHVTGTAEEKNFLQKFHPYVTMQNQEQLSEEFNKAFYHIERNAAPKIVFMDLALKTNELLNKVR
jgi:DNA polymerase-3 subunit delta'